METQNISQNTQLANNAIKAQQNEASAQQKNGFQAMVNQQKQETSQTLLAQAPTQTAQAGGNVEVRDNYFAEENGYNIFRGIPERQGIDALKEDFTSLGSDAERTEFVGKLFEKAGDMAAKGEGNNLAHFLEHGLAEMSGQERAQFSDAMGQAYENGSIDKGDLAAVLSDESMRGVDSRKPNQADLDQITDMIKDTGNKDLMNDSVDVLIKDLASDDNVGLEKFSGGKQESMVASAFDLVKEMHDQGDSRGIDALAKTLDTHNDDDKAVIANNFLRHLASDPDVQSPNKSAGQLDDFIRMVTEGNETVSSGAGPDGKNDYVENIVQNALGHIEGGDTDSIDAVADYMLGGVKENANGEKDYSDSHLQRFLEESTQSAGDAGGEKNDYRLFTDLIRNTVLNTEGEQSTGAKELGDAMADLTQQRIDAVNDIELTPAERKRNANELGTLVGSFQAAAEELKQDKQGLIEIGVGALAEFLPIPETKGLDGIVEDATDNASEKVTEFLGKAATADTKELRDAFEAFDDFESLVIDNTSPQNKPIARVERDGELTQEVRDALGTDAKTMDDLSAEQKDKLDDILDSQETTQDIPGIIREAAGRVKDKIEDED